MIQSFSLSALSVRARIATLVVMATTGLVAAGATYGVGDLSVGQAFDANTQNNRLAAMANELEIGSLQMRRSEKDFLLRLDLAYAEKYHAAADSVLAILDSLSAEEISGSLTGQIEILRERLPAHVAQFETVVGLQEALGMDAESGLQGTLRSAVHAVEQRLADADLPLLTIKMLMMRRHEKDFMLRLDPKYIGRIDERRAEFDVLLAQTSESAVFKQEISGLLDDYQAGFHAWAETTLELQAETALLSTIFREIAPEIEAMTAIAKAGANAAGAELNASRDMTRLTMIVGVAVLLIIMASVGFLVARSIIRPLARVKEAMDALTDGDTTVSLDMANQGSEIAAMARAVEQFRDNAIAAGETAKLQAQEQVAKQQRVTAIETLSTAFDRESHTLLTSVAEASGSMRDTAQSLSTTALENAKQAGVVTSVSEESSTNIQTVASATQELTNSISEISQQVSRSGEIASSAVTQAEKANTTVAGLATAADKIGTVVSLIQEIAEQTNLLALNATIEAARAGDAGKGFAVVASEVKGLANQTAKATEEIAQQIGAMQTATEATVDDIEQVRTIIDQIRENATAIAASVQEQDVATQEIARSVQQVTDGTVQVTDAVQGLSAGTAQTGSAAEHLLGRADELSHQAETLQGHVETFIGQIKAA